MTKRRLDLRSLVIWCSALVLLVGSGVVQGRLIGRWTTDDRLGEAAARLDQFPRELGTWKGTDETLDTREMEKAGITRAILRSYRDSRSGTTLKVMLICGKPGSVSVHTPEVCYAGEGYQLTREPSTPFPGFVMADMERRDAPVLDRLRVYWSFNAEGRWESPTNPRLTFAAKPFLYKLYVLHSSPVVDDSTGRQAVDDFALNLASALPLVAESPAHSSH